MSKRHQSSRRRTYGRRQHELHERSDRSPAEMGWLDDGALGESLHRWGSPQLAREDNEGMLRLRGID